MTTTLGPYVTSGRPDPIRHTFLDDDGAPIDLTGSTPSALLLPPGSSEGVEMDAAIDGDPEDGVVRLDWPFDDGIPTAGTWRGEVWADFPGGPRYPSNRFRFYARAAIPEGS